MHKAFSLWPLGGTTLSHPGAQGTSSWSPVGMDHRDVPPGWLPCWASGVSQPLPTIGRTVNDLGPGKPGSGRCGFPRAAPPSHLHISWVSCPSLALHWGNIKNALTETIPFTPEATASQACGSAPRPHALFKQNQGSMGFTTMSVFAGGEGWCWLCSAELCAVRGRRGASLVLSSLGWTCGFQIRCWEAGWPSMYDGKESIDWAQNLGHPSLTSSLCVLCAHSPCWIPGLCFSAADTSSVGLSHMQHL